ncbi:hypothetical protein P3W33_11825, partial [Luteibacter sp. PPL552]
AAQVLGGGQTRRFFHFKAAQVLGGGHPARVIDFLRFGAFGFGSGEVIKDLIAVIICPRG